MKLMILLLTVCISVTCAKAQSGCTDPQALNYDGSAVANDGSCTYPATSYLPGLVTELQPFIGEASGMAFFNEAIWLHQDGGSGPVLYKMDTLIGSPSSDYFLGTIGNIDWEDLATDSLNLYIGDFGNNSGNRTDLRIYKRSKISIVDGPFDTDIIKFSFSDQTDFTPAYNATNFDCEAFFALNDTLHIFTKRWLDKTTHHYVLPTSAGTYVAQLRDSFDTGFLVTAADISEEGTIALLGYDGNTSVTSMLLLWDYEGSNFLSGNKRTITLGNAVNMSQAEGLVFRTNTEGYICSEKISVLPPKLLRFNIRQWLENPTTAADFTQQLGTDISPNPFANFVNVDYQQFGAEHPVFILMASDGKTMRTGELQSGENRVDTADLPTGIYFFWVKNEDGSTVQKLVKY
ncbi:MAG: T9SS type A sorting domain-containing protein [Bacteroidetes bacterium]|nr:T9SS type A sorting domain-containing protein [Bacteroidota bacterium]